MLWYIITIAIGIILDFVKNKESKHYRNFRNLYIVWLYIFLCFGYMTGSDWRQYEPAYETIRDDIHLVHNEYGFYYLWYFLAGFIKDYWVMVGLLKCIYLTTIIRLTKEITPYWLATVSFLMPISLVFMLIDNPLRYMVALIFVNIALIQFINKKYISFMILGIAAIFFHTTTIVFLATIPMLKFSMYVSNIKRGYIFIAYIVVLYFSSNAELLNNILYSAIGRVMILIEGARDYTENYSLEDNASFFTLGSIINIVLFGVVLLLKNPVLNNHENGRFVYGSVILYLFLQRFCIMIPTGFRLVIPFGIFYATYIVYALQCRQRLAWVFVLYFFLSYPRTIWNTYTLIPYSNSIYYIIAGHKPYSERCDYNIIEYQHRTGNDLEDSGNTINFKEK